MNKEIECEPADFSVPSPSLNLIKKPNQLTLKCLHKAYYGSDHPYLYPQGQSTFAVMCVLLRTMTREDKVAFHRVLVNQMRPCDRRAAFFWYFSSLDKNQEFTKTVMDVFNNPGGGLSKEMVSNLQCTIRKNIIGDLSQDSVPIDVAARIDNENRIRNVVRSNLDVKNMFANKTTVLDDLKQEILDALNDGPSYGPSVSVKEELPDSSEENSGGSTDAEQDPNKSGTTPPEETSIETSLHCLAETKHTPCDLLGKLLPDMLKSHEKCPNQKGDQPPQKRKRRIRPGKRFRFRHPPTSPDSTPTRTIISSDSEYSDCSPDDPPFLMPWKLLQIPSASAGTKRTFEDVYSGDQMKTVSQDTTDVYDPEDPVNIRLFHKPPPPQPPPAVQLSPSSHSGPSPAAQISFSQSSSSVQYNMSMAGGSNVIPNVVNVMQPNAMNPIKQTISFPPMPPPLMSLVVTPIPTSVNNVTNNMNININNNISMQQQGYQTQFNSMPQGSQPHNMSQHQYMPPHNVSQPQYMPQLRNMPQPHNIPAAPHTMQQPNMTDTGMRTNMHQGVCQPYIQQQIKPLALPQASNHPTMQQQNFQQPFDERTAISGGIGETPDNDIICVSNLPSVCSAKMLRDLFVDYGQVTYSAILHNSQGVLQFATHDQAAYAVSSMNQAQFNGLILDVRFY